MEGLLQAWQSAGAGMLPKQDAGAPPEFTLSAESGSLLPKSKRGDFRLYSGL